MESAVEGVVNWHEKRAKREGGKDGKAADHPGVHRSVGVGRDDGDPIFAEPGGDDASQEGSVDTVAHLGREFEPRHELAEEHVEERVGEALHEVDGAESGRGTRVDKSVYTHSAVRKTGACSAMLPEKRPAT